MRACQGAIGFGCLLIGLKDSMSFLIGYSKLREFK